MARLFSLDKIFGQGSSHMRIFQNYLFYFNENFVLSGVQCVSLLRFFSAVGNISGNARGLCTYSELLVNKLCPIS